MAFEENQTCDICPKPFSKTEDGRDIKIDGRTKQGWWGCMCVRCHKIYGVGLGTGKGQQFEGGVKVAG